MLKRWFCLLLVLLIPAVALAKTPQPIDTIPFDELPEVLDGQHHYLMLCTDLWRTKVRPADAKTPSYPGGQRRDLYGNTDGIVLVTFDTRAHRIMLTSFIRDALIKKPNGAIGRINYVYNDYGPEALCKVISEHIGVRVEKYILFNFSQIQSIIDYLGGVDITINSEEAAYLKRYAIPRDSTTPRLRSGGTYHFRGHSAVIYMRIRKAGGGGDFMRTQRVRNVLSELADQCREISYEDARALVDVILEQSTMTNMSLNDVITAMEQAYGLRGCTIEELRIPIDGAVHGIHYAGMDAQELDWGACRAAMADYLENSFLVLDEDDGFDDFLSYPE